MSHAEPDALEHELEANLAGAEPAVRLRILEWAKRLIDLSRRNRLLNYKPTRRTTLVFQDPSPDDIVERLMEGGSWGLYVPPPILDKSVAPDLDEILRRHPRKSKEVVSTERDPTELGKNLEAIARRAKAEYDDRAIHTLHLVWGLLKWIEPGSPQEWTAPLLLVPIELARPSRSEGFELKPTEDDATLNPALRVKLENDFGISLPEIDLNETALADVVDRVKASIGTALPPGWHVEAHAALGMFSFAKEPMYRDLVQNANQIQQHPAVRTLALGSPVDELLPQLEVALPDEEHLDEAQSPANMYSVLDADSSQRIAIEAAVRGQSFVLLGPPGTGKSQTIANVISELVAHGKSVLFVSQKAAALDVVANRLGAVDLRDLLLELHSAKASRAGVAMELARTLDEQAEFHDGGFPAASGTLTATRSTLNEYARAIHEIRTPLEASMYEVLGRIEHLIDVPALPSGPVDSVQAHASDLEALAALVARLADAWEPVEAGVQFAWRDSLVRTFSPVDRQRILDALAKASSATERIGQLEAHLSEWCQRTAPQNLQDRDDLEAIGKLACAPMSAPIEWLTNNDLEPLAAILDRWQRITADRRELAERLAARYGPKWQEIEPDLAVQLSAALEGAESILTKPLTTTPIQMVEGCAIAASSAAAEVERAQVHVDELRRMTGIRSRGDGLADIELLLQVSRLTQQRNRPPGMWLARARLGDAAVFLDEHGGEYESYQSLRVALLADYDDAFLSIEIEPILARMNRSHGHWWSPLRSSYRRDRALLRGLHRTRSLSPSILADLENLAKLSRDGRQLAGRATDAGQALGPYARGLETEIPAAREALAAARVLIDLPHDATDWDVLNTAATAESPMNPAIDRRADELDESQRRALKHLSVVGEIAQESWTENVAALPQSEAIATLLRLAAHLFRVRDLLAGPSGTRREPFPDVASAVEDAGERARVEEIDQEIRSSEDDLKRSLHSGWVGLSTDWPTLRAGLAWSMDVRHLYDGQTLSDELARLISSGTGLTLPWTDYRIRRVEHADPVSTIAELFDASRRSGIVGELSGTTPAALGVLAELAARIEQLSTWVRFRAAFEALEERGWAPFATAAIERVSDRTSLVESARRAWYAAWAEALAKSDPRLGQFALEEHQRTIAAFEGADRKLIRLARERVLRRYEERKPASVTLQGGEQAKIRREAAKRRRHVPVRTLLGSIPTMLPRLKPCLMMSPLSVSHFLTPEMTFDVVVFDEASQVPPEDAINCIYRGKQLIVAGDPKQLPPTAFFQLAADLDTDTDLETQVDDFESVLDLAQASSYPLRPLRWHYRSRHDSLIAFSNHFIYANSLVTFPPPHREGDELGVSFVHVPDGVFDRGRSARNSVEAMRVVDEIVKQLRARPDQTVGVVAFSVAQQECIQDEWERRLKLEPDLEIAAEGDRLRALFIKNLETVQGDERDVIIFSIGYGRDETGRFLMNFGPLNRNGGWRRLNVAITRARDRVIVVSSIRADDFRIASPVPGAVEQRGSELLRAYLDFAERGILPGPELATASRGTSESPFESDVARAVAQLGYDVTPQVGVSTYRVDLGVVSKVRPSRFALGIECDGASYHSAKTARDRDRLREEVLRGLGWRIHRVWSQDWFSRRALALERIRQAIEAAEREEQHAMLERSGTAQPPTVASSDVGSTPIAIESGSAASTLDGTRQRVARESVDLTDTVDASKLPWTVPNTQVEIPKYRDSYLEFHDPGLAKEHAKRIVDVVSREGPVHIEGLAARLARSFGLQRVGSRMSVAIEDAVRRAERDGAIRQKGPFVWPASLKEVQAVRVPVPGRPETLRQIDEIPPEEIDLTLLRVLETAVQASDADLRTAAARVLGFSRTGDQIGTALESRIRQLNRSKKITTTNGSWQVAIDLPRLTAKAPAPARPTRPAAPDSDAPDIYTFGEWIRHPAWGVGRVVDVSSGLVTLRYGKIDRRIQPSAVKLERADAPDA